MSRSSSPIFIPSRSSSPMNSAGNTPYIVTSPPPDSPTSDELTLPHEQMIQHIAHLFNIEEEEVHRQFPTVRSLLPIDRSPPAPTSVLTPNTFMMAHLSTTFNDVDDYEGIHASPNLGYPGTELTDYASTPATQTAPLFPVLSHFPFLPLTFTIACRSCPQSPPQPTPHTPCPSSPPLLKTFHPVPLPLFLPWPWSYTNRPKPKRWRLR